MPILRRAFLVPLLFLAVSATTRAQTAPAATDAVRVTVSMNADGSRTTYEWDTANHKATATTVAAGKVREKILYGLDDAGRFATGQVFGPKNTLRFSTLYKYDAAGRLAEEAQMTKDGAIDHKIVYAFDSAGKPIGYAVYDGAGKLLGRTTAPAARAAH